MQLHNIAVQSMATEGHVLICGYGRSGQNLARFLDREGVPFIALDNDPQRIREATAAGERVVFGDAARREVLLAAGLARARVLIVTYADTASALHIIAHVQEARPGLPVVVRTIDDSDVQKLRDAGATEVVADLMEASLMLASSTLMLVGVPLNRVLRRIRETRESRYELFRGFFRGMTDASEGGDQSLQPRLHSVLVTAGAKAIGKPFNEINLAGSGVEVTALRRRNVKTAAPAPDMRIEEGDVIVLMGTEAAVAAAEMRLLQG
jgi:CPA2 family monovalent cation:H+ antiporter-2